ncbi:MAG: hypothetical protein AB9M60_07315, partial [Leptothrix sp. (in: b-proteobacteria)]
MPLRLTPAGADAGAAPAVDTTAATSAVLEAGGVFSLGASELVQLTLLRNATLQAAQLQLQAAGSLVEAEAALYDPTAYGLSLI